MGPVSEARVQLPGEVPLEVRIAANGFPVLSYALVSINKLTM